jgi:hypothetical protein
VYQLINWCKTLLQIPLNQIVLEDATAWSYDFPHGYYIT